jgi:mRNA-degrading endonuclease YafQ of YafQ-DinJ toxin-antitoxin module
MSQFNEEIFEGKKFGDILQEIYKNQTKKDKQINALINELKPLINEIGDATLIVPLIKDYLDMSIKNDDILIKMATLSQRALAKQLEGEGGDLTEAEKQQLLDKIQQMNK